MLLTRKQWDEVHAARSWGRYPSEHLVRFVARNFYNGTRSEMFLDLGCGAGSNSWFLDREGFAVCGVDESQHAVARAAEENMRRAEFHVADVERTLPFKDETFDCAVDVCCLQHVIDIRSAVRQVCRVLVPGGRLFSVMAALNHSIEASPVSFMRLAMSESHVAELLLPLRVDCVDVSMHTDHGRRVSHWIVEATRV